MVFDTEKFRISNSTTHITHIIPHTHKTTKHNTTQHNPTQQPHTQQQPQVSPLKIYVTQS